MTWRSSAASNILSGFKFLAARGAFCEGILKPGPNVTGRSMRSASNAYWKTIRVIQTRLPRATNPRVLANSTLNFSKSSVRRSNTKRDFPRWVMRSSQVEWSSLNVRCVSSWVSTRCCFAVRNRFTKSRKFNPSLKLRGVRPACKSSR